MADDIDRPETSTEKTDRIMKNLGLSSPRIEGTIVKIRSDGEIKLFGITIKKGKRNEK